MLASIEDPSEQEFIENNMKIFQDSQTFFWTGLYKNHKGMVHCSNIQTLKRQIFSYRWKEYRPKNTMLGEKLMKEKKGYLEKKTI